VKRFLAIDLGAESGKSILGIYDEEKVILKEIYRFPNSTINIMGSLHWNILQLYKEIIQSLIICGENEGFKPDAIGIDTWGVDYALLSREGYFLGIPYAYRDKRTNNAVEEFVKDFSQEQIYNLTGIQFLQFNTLFQLYAEKKNHPLIFNSACDLLFMPDIFNYLLTGTKRSEFSFATTSQLFNPRKNEWVDELFIALGVSKSIMQEVVPPGTIIGYISEHIGRQTGIKDIPVVAVASHDTASAVAAIPAAGKNWAYISSGTWSLMGIENDWPIINKKSYQYNFTNEGGVGSTFRVLKNITGLWLLQQCKKSWKNQRDYSYDDLITLASKAPLCKVFIDPDHSAFFNPENMPTAISDYCRDTGQQVPEDHGECVQIILQSLALKYRYVLEQLQEISSKKIEKIYVTGGGIQNQLLNQYIANATGVRVITALAEGTAAGNIMVQAMALEEIDSPAGIRKVINNSIETQHYEPQQVVEWNEAYTHFLNFI
jgi:rhamnulokinase